MAYNGRALGMQSHLMCAAATRSSQLSIYDSKNDSIELLIVRTTNEHSVMREVKGNLIQLLANYIEMNLSSAGVANGSSC
jgi:hypothetical protein